MTSADSGLRQLAKLKRRIKVLASDIEQVYKTGASAISDSTQRALFRGMFTTLQNTFDLLRENWDKAIDVSEVYRIDPEFPTEDDDVLMTTVRKHYFECQSYHLQLMPPPPQPSLVDMSMNSSSLMQSAPKARTILPKIQIKRFSGNWADWPTFKQLFCSLIKEEHTLTDAERFQYLVSYLEGPALGAIKHIPVTDINFEQAWNCLVRVYDDKRKLASSYLERLLNFKMSAGKPTAESLQSYLSQVSESISSLKNLKITDMDDYLLCELALRVLDPKTRQAFELANVGTTFPKFDKLKEFVQDRYHVLRLTDTSCPKVNTTKPVQHSKAPQSPNKFAPKAQALLTHSSKPEGGKTSPKQQDASFSCFICKQPHIITSCPQYLAMDPPQRLAALKPFQGCRNCLHPGHRTKECTSKFVCRECDGKHHSTLHLTPNSGQPKPSGATENSNSSSTAGFSGTNTSNEVPSVLLGTVVASIPDAQGKLHRIRGLLDAGSQYTMITAKCASMLNMVFRPYHGSISGVNNSPLHNIKGKVPLLFNTNCNSNKLKTEAIVVPAITPPLPQTPLHSSMWEDYRSYQLSDPTFTEPGPISFLIGADLYPEVVTGAPIAIYEDGPRLIDTVFGFTVVGRLLGESNGPSAVSLLTYSDTDALIEKFWLLEEPSQPTVPSPEEERCEHLFNSTHYRTPEGRYVVTLPFKSDKPTLALNTNQALTRLYSLESKLAKDPDLRNDYVKFMKEYEDLGHMSVAVAPPKYIIPHHAVYRVTGNEKKLRVVFDGSCRTLGGSLNDQLLAGPKLQADICSVVLNFRKYRYVFTCDIVKMFRQIDVAADDRCYQQIAWRDDPQKPVTFYQLNTVTYGTRSAPYLAQRVVRQLAYDEGDAYPNAAHALLNNIYVDDIAVGRDSEQDLLHLKRELIELLSKGCMELSKWASNLPSLLQSESQGSQSIDFCSDEISSTKILGMKWCPVSDTLSYDVSECTPGFTKRIILSTIAQLYDPLGYLAPTVFFAKCIMQETWKSNIGWDDEIPEDLKTLWVQYTSELHLLSNISIPRCLPKTDTSYQLLCFSDASEKGYCAAAYLRGTNGDNITLTLLKAKTRLAPLKSLTIPRLELCGALLLTELLKSLEPLKSDLNISETFCFTDSMIVLAWLRTMPHLLQTFVSNRVQQILQVTQVEQWHHIKGAQNPADVGSRGTLPSTLGDHGLWWTGPAWAYNHIDQWPLSNNTHGIDIPELRTTKLALITVDNCQGFIKYSERHSSWLKLIRVIAYIKRFISNSQIPKKFKCSRLAGPLSSVEITASNHHCIKLIQHTYFPDVFITASANTLPLELRRLAVFVDGQGLIRVGGRLSNAPIPMEQRHPLLLPNKCHFSLLLVRHLHILNHHAGPTTLLATLRLNYWIPKARNIVKLVKRKCTTCTRFSKTQIMPFMGDLPASRFAGVRPFLISGVDFAGPFLCKETSRRKAFSHKCYLGIFVCMSSRAYHLELVVSLSAEAFLDAFSRFTARRGIPKRMMSDCGTNFVGAANYLRELEEWFRNQETQDTIINCTAHLDTQWSFNPPGAPHFGGSWEVGVKSVKSLLYKTFGNHTYTQDELSTMFVKIEGILNSRPLQPLSNSVDDPEALTPGHFIIGQPLNALPEVDLSDIPANRLSSWQLIRERVQHFWTRWSQEYLNTLQTRNKWLNQAKNLKIGDLVFISDANAPPACWPMGRVQSVHPGQDGTVRVVTLKTQSGTLKRPSVKLIPLPMSDE